ncbi:Uncharacterized protein FWK35_00001114 [Aphis craccivora]|uniref:Uncharacterized protein n=1 Tax=Aphis craccivora TaxID=307492 RepID=A0A6G0ZL82_APHCR|nr:Uncharacterized protein FWK35_00001114 [Aphis craccivora]
MFFYTILFAKINLKNITSRNNAPTSNFGGGFRCKSEYPWCIIEKLFTQNQFLTKSIFFMVVIQKLITINT